jgi:hypothetical protein
VVGVCRPDFLDGRRACFAGFLPVDFLIVEVLVLAEA